MDDQDLYFKLLGCTTLDEVKQLLKDVKIWNIDYHPNGVLCDFHSTLYNNPSNDAIQIKHFLQHIYGKIHDICYYCDSKQCIYEDCNTCFKFRKERERIWKVFLKVK